MGKSNLSRQEFKDLFDQLFEGIRSYIYYRTGDIDLAEDLVQDVFLKLWEKRDLVKRETIKSYLYTIAHNMIINQAKRQQLMYNFMIKSKVMPTEHETPDFIMEKKEFHSYLNHVLASIPEPDRVVFLMNRIEQLKYSEIAERLGLSVKAVEKRMSKALDIIREMIKDPI